MKKHLIVLFLIGIFYYAFTRWSGYYLPCIFYKITGYVCPGCGISHLCSDLLSLHWGRAILQNIGVSIVGAIYLLWLFLKHGLKLKWCHLKNEHYLMMFFVVFLLLFGILRNLPMFEWLLPYYMR